MMELTEEIRALIRLHNLEEDLEHVIIPLPEKGGHKRRCFLLKRRFMRLVYAEGVYADFPLEEIIEAVIRNPELPLSESLLLLHRELGTEIPKIFDQGSEPVQ